MRRVLERQIDIHKLGVLLVVYAYIERRAFSLVLYLNTRRGENDGGHPSLVDMSYSDTRISIEMSTMMIHSRVSLFLFCKISK